jgi:hypothetical protein
VVVFILDYLDRLNMTELHTRSDRPGTIQPLISCHVAGKDEIVATTKVPEISLEAQVSRVLL